MKLPEWLVHLTARGARGVDVRFDQSRNDRVSLRIERVRLRSDAFANVRITSDRDEHAVLDRDRRCARGRATEGQHLAVDDDEVGGSFSGGKGGGKNEQRGGTAKTI